MGSPSQSPFPKSGWSEAPGPMAAMYPAERGVDGEVGHRGVPDVVGREDSAPGRAPGSGLAPAA